MQSVFVQASCEIRFLRALVFRSPSLSLSLCFCLPLGPSFAAVPSAPLCFLLSLFVGGGAPLRNIMLEINHSMRRPCHEGGRSETKGWTSAIQVNNRAMR